MLFAVILHDDDDEDLERALVFFRYTGHHGSMNDANVVCHTPPHQYDQCASMRVLLPFVIESIHKV